jgi:hypothetical protein
MIAAARAVKAIAKDEGAAVSGGDNKLNGKKRRGIPLRAKDEITEHGDRVTCRVQGNPGAWVWVTDGTRPHTTRRRKKGPKRKLLIRHPGSSGKGAWRKVRARSTKVVPEIFRTAVKDVMR